MKIAILPNMTRADAPQTSLRVCAKLDELGAVYLISEQYRAYFSQTSAQFLADGAVLEACDLLLTVGGDGSIIHAAKQAASRGKPVLGINAGCLAFMAGLESNELQLLERLIQGGYAIDRRLMLRAAVLRGEELLSEGYCVNDAVVSLAAERRIVELDVTLDGQFLNRYKGDGLIAATPTGSTAYSLSAGGPVVDPQLESILLTPICAHSLFSRSLLFKSEARLCVSSPAGKELLLSRDGETPDAVSSGCRVVIEKADRTADFIRIKSDHFIHVLDHKLAQWQDRF